MHHFDAEAGTPPFRKKIYVSTTKEGMDEWIVEYVMYRCKMLHQECF
jgi:hypothetical protein